MNASACCRTRTRCARTGGGLRPSVDLPHHLFLYRHLSGVRSIIHTHSNHATAFAACCRPIPLCLTAIADEFGGEVPCTPYVDNEGDAIGTWIEQSVVARAGRSRYE